VYDIAVGQVVTAGDDGISRLYGAERPGLLRETGTGGSVDRTGDPSPALESPWMTSIFTPPTVRSISLPPLSGTSPGQENQPSRLRLTNQGKEKFNNGKRRRSLVAEEELLNCSG
jgi:hypothetical protein